MSGIFNVVRALSSALAACVVRAISYALAICDALAACVVRAISYALAICYALAATDGRFRRLTRYKLPADRLTGYARQVDHARQRASPRVKEPVKEPRLGHD